MAAYDNKADSHTIVMLYNAARRAMADFSSGSHALTRLNASGAQ
jgi:hypothetical protein